jgi:phenylacetate-CoA ligase
VRIPRGFVRLRRSAAFLRHFRGQARFPFRPWEEVRRAQNERLARTVRFAWEHVPYYRAAMDQIGMRPEDVRAVEDLAALPIVEGAAVQELGDALLPGGRPSPAWIRVRSGGSTGAPKTIYLDPDAFLASVATRERARAAVVPLIGRRTGYREAVFAPPEGIFRKIEERVYELLWAPRFMRVQRDYFSLYDEPKTMLPRLAELRAEHYHGYGSHIARFFQHLLESGEAASFPLPRVISFTSDDMPPAVRRAVTDRLGIPIFSVYGAVEALNMGFTCGEGEGFHLNVDLYPLRIVDEAGRTLPPGESGSVVISNLESRGTVLLNYRIGDHARLLEAPCPCGRTLPRLASLEGRDDEWVARADGGRLHGQAVRTLFTHQDDRVWGYRVVQEEADRFTVTLVPARGVDRDLLAADVLRLFRGRFGQQTRVDLAFVEKLERTGGGKVRPFISRVRTKNGAPS